MDSKNPRFWAPIGAAFALFGALDLVVLLLMPAPARREALLPALVPPIVAAVVVVLTLPSLLTLFERQQDRIERQGRELTTLHAMDTAIAAELEMTSLLDVAVHQATRALEAEQGGIALVDAAGRLQAEAYYNLPDPALAPFRRLLLEGGAGGGGDDAWESARVPLQRTPDEPPLGYLAVVKRRPTVPFAPSDHALLSALAGTVVVALTNVFALEAARAGERKAQQLAAVQEELRRERRIAQALQEALLPQIPERIGPWLLSRRYEAQSPEAQVGGDIYDLFPLDAGRLGVLIADVSGKGLVAAQKTAMVKYALRSYAREHASPAEVVTRLNDALFDEPDLTGFVTLVYGVLSDEDGGFTYASAGHETPLVRRRDGTFEALAPTGIVLGAVRDQEYGEASVVLSAGDGLLLYTDGLTEARTAGGDFLDVEGLQGILERLRDCPPREMADALLAAVRAYAGGSLSDDTAVLWIQRAAPGEPPPADGD